MLLRPLVYALGASIAFASGPALAAAPAYQGALSDRISGPRKVSATPEGDVLVVDARGRLHRLTRRGDRVGVLLNDVASVAAGSGVAFAALRDGTLVRINPRSGRVQKRVALGTHEPPAALAYDAERGNVWLAFASGALQARTADGAVVYDIASAAGGSYGLAGVAVDPAGTVWVLQARTGSGSTVRSYDAVTGAFQRALPVDVRIGGGIAFSGGKLYATDLFSGKVAVVAVDGGAASAVGSRGNGPGQLEQPSSVALLPNGDVLVANMDANRLDRFGDGSPLPACPGDSDCDGLPDAWELANGLDPKDPTDALIDQDGDGLNSAEEYAWGTNPRSSDTDGDGHSDGAEVAAGLDPRNADDHRPQVLAQGGATDPGLVRITASVNDPVETRGTCSTKWRQVAGARVTLQGANSLSPSFIARKAGAYRFEVVATCGKATSPAKQIEVAVRNVAPRADGGRTLTLAAGTRIELSGSFTTDANADAVARQWDQVLGPPVAGSVRGADLAADGAAPGYYVFRLGAIDAAGAEGGAEVSVIVLGDAQPPTAAVSSPVVARAGEAVTLDASPSYRGPNAAFAWEQVAGPRVSLDGASSPAASFVPPAAGRYAFDVTVSENGLRSPAARVEVYAAAAGAMLPVAVATAPAVAAVDTAVTLEGSASVAGAGGALSYSWRQVSGPAAGLTRADAVAATVVLFEPGSYEFELGVSEDGTRSLPARVRIEARAQARPIPVAVATALPTAKPGDLVLLDGRASTGALRHRWTQVEGPWVAVEQASVAWVRPTVPGVYAFELVVDDGTVRSAPAKVSVVVMP
jgi:Bacterial TSP3 repeat